MAQDNDGIKVCFVGGARYQQPLNAKDAKKREQDPGDRIIDWPRNKPAVGLPVHRGNQEQIDNPANEKEAASEEPNSAGNRFAIIKPM